ncbi:MAG TPA: ATP-binding cassette domain-containing protein [Hanamia sp.]|nr:ATP-binding cassette domain-containing protein [Hanamia sp.]
MISLQNVVKLFGNTKAVNDISFEVDQSENVVLLGTSGCGKTTTLRMINRLTETTSGSIRIGGKNIQEVSPEELRRNIGYVLQHNGLFPHYTIAENIAIVPELLKWSRQKIAARIEELIEQLSLSKEYLSLYPRQLSGGQQQRVGLARALAADPPVLLMDEPFGALDAITRESITKEFLNLEVLKNKTIVMVTHDIREAFTLGDKILLMHNGKIVQAGKAVDFLFRPANKFVEDFFSAQRMQLELNAVILKDIWMYLDGDNPITGGKKLLSPERNEGFDFSEIGDDKSLWDALDLLNLQKKKLLLVRNLRSGEIRYASYNSLFTALGALKQKVYE